MIEKDRTEEIASTHLGKRVEMCDQYNPDLLVAVPRIDNRRHYNIDNNNLPFEGWDIWHAYEFFCPYRKWTSSNKITQNQI